MVKKIICVLAAVVLLAAGVFAGVKIVPKFTSTKNTPTSIDVDIIDTETVEKIIEQTSELVVTNYSYKDIYKYEKSVEKLGIKIPFSTNQFVLSYEGKVKGGIDFSKIEINIDNDKKIITLKMPKPYIISHEIDEKSMEYFDVKKSIFKKYTLTDYSKLIGDLKDKKEKEIIKDEEFINSVTENSQKVLSGFLLGSEKTSDYELIFS